jgi:SAM-dependent methyltransferase
MLGPDAKADAAVAGAAASPAAAPETLPGGSEPLLDADVLDDGPACPAQPILALDRCPVCDTPESTPVGRYNKFLLQERLPDPQCAIYDYAMCHGCGVVYATLRPAGERYAWLLEHFEESIGRVEFGERRSGKVTLSSYALTDERREELRRLVSKGVYVSEHSGMSRKDFLPALMADRINKSVHVEILGSLVPMHRPRVLEIRSRLGSISAMLQRLYQADCQAMTLFENQQFLIEEAYGIPAVSPIDYQQFTVPFEGRFDLIVANHMVTHAVHPRDFLATLHRHLVPGGHLYLYGEFIEREFLEDGSSMFNTMNPFHMQTFNGPSAVRALEANGFRVIFTTTHENHFVGLAQRSDEITDAWPRMEDRERRKRIAAYRLANDLAVLRVPDGLRDRVAKEWDGALERSLANGTAELMKKGHVKVRPPKAKHSAGREG